MYYYFSSEYPAVLKLNGIYCGAIHNAVKSCNAQGEEPPFVEICPLGGNDKPIAFILDDEFLSSPPSQISLTDLGGGYMLNFFSSFLTSEFKVYCQQKFSSLVATVFSENGNKLSIETPSDFYAENIFLELNSVEIVLREKYKNLLIVYLYGKKTLVNIYNVSGNIRKIFSREVDTAEFKDSLVTVENLSNMAKHKITTEWQFSGEKFTAKNKKIEAQNPLDLDRLNEKVIPFAFLEQLLVGGEVKDYLCEELRENADKLRGFLGEFIGVMPPPVFRDIDEVGLIYQKEKNVYKVEYFKFKLDKRKITNITC